MAHLTRYLFYVVVVVAFFSFYFTGNFTAVNFFPHLSP